MEPYIVPISTLEKLGNGCPMAGRRILRSLIDLEVEHEPINGPTEKPKTVRPAVQADEENILALVREDIAENARHIAPANEDKIMDAVRGATRKGMGTIGVIDTQDGLAGMICLQPCSWWWSAEWYVFEQWNFVAKRHRKSRYATDLIQFSKWFVDAMSEQVGYRVTLLSGVTAVHQVHSKVALYRRLSNYVGAFYAYPNPAIS